MTRRALARVAPVLFLLAGGFGAVALTPLPAAAAPAQPSSLTDRDHAPAIAADVAANEVVTTVSNRTSDDAGRGTNRLFSVTLAALVALASLLAARRARMLVAFAAHRDAPLDARRRGPPLLRCA